jgi:hypothetical protein
VLVQVHLVRIMRPVRAEGLRIMHGQSPPAVSCRHTDAGRST